MSNNPSFKDSTYTKRIAAFQKMDDFREGLEAVKGRLIQWEREDDKAFASRKERATLYNATKKIVNASVGMIFSKEIAYTDLCPQFMEIEDDVDNNDSDLNEFMKECAESALWSGISYILLDTPTSDIQPETLQQQRELGIRPYFTKIEAKQVINKRFSHINGTNQLTQMTIEETVTEYEEGFSEKEVTQWRVLFIGGGMVYRKKQDDTYSVVKTWATGLSYIPIVPVYSNKVGFFDATPKLIDIADLNLKHFNYQSQLDKTLFIAANPIPVIWGRTGGDNDSISGGKSKEVVIGVDTAITFRDKNEGDFAWVEFEGKSVDKLQEEIKNIETRIATLGLSMLTQANTTKTATERKIDSAEENSDLSSFAKSIEWSANTAYIYFCDMVKANPTGEIKVNDEFVDSSITPEQAKVYLDMHRNGEMTLDQLWTELEHRDFIEEISDRDMAKAELEAQNQNVTL